MNAASIGRSGDAVSTPFRYNITIQCDTRAQARARRKSPRGLSPSVPDPDSILPRGSAESIQDIDPASIQSAGNVGPGKARTGERKVKPRKRRVRLLKATETAASGNTERLRWT